MKLISIGSIARGAGRAMFQHIRAKHPEKTLWCKARSVSTGFYDALGMKRGLAISVGGELGYLYST